MKVNLIAVVTLIAVEFSCCTASEPECVYREIRGLPMHWANPIDCERFYRCTSKGIKREIRCPSGREYSAKTGKCVTIGRGACQLSLLAPVADENNVCANEVSGAYIPRTGYCRDFYICNDGVAYPQYCPSGTVFNTTGAHCVSDDDAACWQNYCIRQSDNIQLADSTSCRTYYQCNNDEADREICALGSYYNKIMLSCQLDDNHDICWENICINQGDGTYIANERNCNSFYVCNNQLPIEQNCPIGSYFDRNNSNCQPGDCPYNTTTSCTCPGGYAEGDFLAHPTDCRLFYICERGQLLEQSCLLNNYFDSVQGLCVRDTDNICPESLRKPRSIKSNPTNEKPLHQHKSIFSKVNTYSSEDFESLLNTNDYGQEIHSIHQFTTPEPMNERLISVIDDDLHELDTIHSVKTSDSIIEKSIGQYPKELQPININQLQSLHKIVMVSDSVDNDNYNQFEIDENQNTINAINKIDRINIAKITNNAAVIPKKLEHFNSIQLTEDPYDCQRYKIHHNDQIFNGDCGAGKYFNTISKACEFDIDMKCTKNQRKFTNLNNENESREVNFMCPNNIKEGQMVEYEGECALYYMCINGAFVEGTCGNGNYFNVDEQLCEPDTNNICGPKDNNGCNSTIDVNTICFGQENNVTLEHPHACNEYIECVNDIGIVKNCPDGQYFDTEFKRCLHDYEAVCINPCANSTHIKLLRHPDCSKYYFCNNGETHVNSCKNGEAFNDSLHKCTTGLDCPESVCFDQPDGTAYPIEGESIKFFVCLGGIAKYMYCPPDQEFSLTYYNCGPAPSSDCEQSKCICDLEETTLDPNGCLSSDNSNTCELPSYFPPISGESNAFCYCRDNQAYKDFCAEGYIFDPIKNECYSNASCDPKFCIGNKNYEVSPNRNNSHKFCLCVMGEPIEVDCPNNAIFNVAELACELEEPSDEQCSSTYCISQPNYSSFLPLDGSNGICVCYGTAGKYKPCNNEIVNPTLAICMEPCNYNVCLGNKYATFPTFDPYSYCFCETETFAVLKTCNTGQIYDADGDICVKEICNSLYCYNTVNKDNPFPANEGYEYGFCTCTDTKPVFSNCTDGYLFNSEHLVCLPADQFYCNVSLCIDTTAGYPYTIPAIDDPYGFCLCVSFKEVIKYNCPTGQIYGPDNYCIADPSESNCTCPGGYANGQFVANRNDCQKFYICEDTVLIEGDCGANNFFNTYTSTCELDINGTCLTINGDDCSCEGDYNHGDLIPNPTNSTSYFVCYNGKLLKENCILNYIFDATQKMCVPPPANKTTKNYRSNDVNKNGNINANDDVVVEDVRSFKILTNFFKKFMQS